MNCDPELSGNILNVTQLETGKVETQKLAFLLPQRQLFPNRSMFEISPSPIHTVGPASRQRHCVAGICVVLPGDATEAASTSPTMGMSEMY